MTQAQTPATHPRAALRPWATALAVVLLFTASGSVGLIYEVTWKHLFTAVFGSTTYAVSVVISVFMAGLAMGSFVFGKVADRARRHLLIYALLEAGIGVSALLVPYAQGQAEVLYGAVFRTTQSPATLTFVQVLVSAAILLVPTFLMGGTLPVLSRYMASLRGDVGPAVGILYGLNTLGAAAGAFVTGFVLIKALGTLHTIYLAAACNFALCVAFLALNALAGPSREAQAEDGRAASGAPNLGKLHLALLLMAVCVSGFVSFSYEVLWTRVLSFRLETSVYAFSTMLTTFLLGLGLGGAATGFLMRTRTKAHYWRIYACLEAAVGVCGLATVLLFFSPRHGYDSFAQRVLGELGISALVMLVPTTLLGAAFPVACHLYASGIRETGRTVGRLYVFNTLGCVAGALLTGFYLVRALGTQWSLTAASFLMVASAGALFTWAPGARAGLVRRAAPAGAFAAVALAVWAATPADYLARFFVRNQYLLVSKPDAKVSLLGFGEGVEGVVVVCEFEGGNRTIATGSTDVAGTGYILRTTQKLQAHVPMLIHPNPKDVCQVGFGSGETAYLFTTYGLDRFDCVEISQAVVDMAAAYFTDINHGAARSPACHLVVMDGAAYLKYTPQRYDVIANDSIWPHLAGNSALYTVEYFRDGREHLKPGGIMTSWLPLEMPVSDFRSLLASFHAVFPHVYLWTALQPDNKHALLVGSLEPLQVDTARFVERFERYAREDLKLLYLSDPAAFLACHLATIEGHPLDLATAPLNTVDRPVLQYLGSSPDLFRAATRGGLIADCLRFLAQHRDSVLNHVANTHGLEAQGALLGRVRAMDEATTHVLRAMVSRWDDPAGSAAEYREAMRLAPEHPYFLVASRVGADRGAKYLADLPKLDLATVKEQARSAFGEGAYAEARALYAEWTRREPTSAAAYAGLGLACVNIGRLAEAQEALTRAASLDPSLADAHLGLGAIYMRSGRLPAAIERLQTAVKLEPGSANAHAQLGAAYALSARRSEAEAELERAIELDPRLANAHGNLGTLLLQDGDAAGAVQHLEKFVELRPDSAQGHRSLGEAYAKAGNAEMAERHLRRAAELERTGPQGAPQGAARQE